MSVYQQQSIEQDLQDRQERQERQRLIREETERTNRRHRTIHRTSMMLLHKAIYQLNDICARRDLIRRYDRLLSDRTKDIVEQVFHGFRTLDYEQLDYIRERIPPPPHTYRKYSGLRGGDEDTLLSGDEALSKIRSILRRVTKILERIIKFLYENIMTYDDEDSISATVLGKITHYIDTVQNELLASIDNPLYRTGRNNDYVDVREDILLRDPTPSRSRSVGSSIVRYITGRRSSSSRSPSHSRKRSRHR